MRGYCGQIAVSHVPLKSPSMHCHSECVANKDVAGKRALSAVSF